MVPAVMLTVAGVFISVSSIAAGPPVPSIFSHSLAIVLLVVIVALLLIMALLAYVLLGAAEIALQHAREEKKTPAIVVTLALVCLSLFYQLPMQPIVPQLMLQCR